ncbi:hypothetical protein C8J57DRAFT_1509262 [Mycena rebaudengoi]|nr:hypothetical protein C8J57DRAFT_1509262 [Mycena rebaudengoi]
MALPVKHTALNDTLGPQQGLAPATSHIDHVALPSYTTPVSKRRYSPLPRHGDRDASMGPPWRFAEGFITIERPPVGAVLGAYADSTARTARPPPLAQRVGLHNEEGRGLHPPQERLHRPRAVVLKRDARSAGEPPAYEEVIRAKRLPRPTTRLPFLSTTFTIASHRSSTTPPSQLTDHAARNAHASYARTESPRGFCGPHAQPPPPLLLRHHRHPPCHHYIPSHVPPYAHARPSPGPPPPPVSAPYRHARPRQHLQTRLPSRGSRPQPLLLERATAPRTLYHPSHAQPPLLFLFRRALALPPLHPLVSYRPLRACSSMPTRTAHSSSGPGSSTSRLPRHIPPRTAATAQLRQCAWR